MRAQIVIAVSVLLSFAARSPLRAQSAEPAPRCPISPREIARDWKRVDRDVTVVDSAGKSFVRLDARKEGGMVWTPAVDFSDGEIAFDARGQDVLQKSFVGVVFRTAADSAIDVVYLRPFNFNSSDSTRHAHAVQYAAYPEFPWEKLRAEHPGQYENAVQPGLDPNGWVHVRLVVRGTDLRMFLNESAAPVLHVQTLSGRRRGNVGLWVGSDSPGDFANVCVRATP